MRILFSLLLVISASNSLAESPFHGSWAFSLPDGNPAWLSIQDGEDGKPEGELLWSVGSAKPVQKVVIQDGQLAFERKITWKPGGEAENNWIVSEPFTGTLVKNGYLKLESRQHPKDEPEKSESLEIFGKKMPPMPPMPDLSKVTFGEPVTLFNGQDLTGWKLTKENKTNGWRAEDGILSNETPKTDFGAYGDYGNLATEAVFEDFRLTIEYNAPEGGNSGIYLRGMYEAQVVDKDSRMQGIQGPGAIFGRIAPSRNAGKPGGEWNRYVLTLVDRHITVELNGELVIDNQPLEGCTGGGISADDTAPGPIFLQGDHTNVMYRNIVLEPVVK